MNDLTENEVLETKAETTKPQKTAEQLASENNLDAALNETLGFQAVENEAGQQTENAVTVTDAAQSLEGLLSLLPIGLDAVGYKKTAAVWSEQARKNISITAIPVLRKYGWGLRFIEFLEGGTGVHEAALFFAVYPVAVATMKAVEMDANDLKPKQAETTKASDLPPLDMAFEPDVFGTNRKQPVTLDFAEYDARN